MSYYFKTLSGEAEEIGVNMRQVAAFLESAGYIDSPHELPALIPVGHSIAIVRPDASPRPSFIIEYR